MISIDLPLRCTVVMSPSSQALTAWAYRPLGLVGRLIFKFLFITSLWRTWSKHEGHHYGEHAHCTIQFCCQTISCCRVICGWKSSLRMLVV